MIYPDENDWDGGVSMGGYPLGGINLGGARRRRVGRPRKHPMMTRGSAGNKAGAKKNDWLKFVEAHRGDHLTLKELSKMYKAQGHRVAPKKAPKRTRRDALHLRQRAFGPPMSLTHAQQMHLSKWLKSIGHGVEGPCPVCEGSGFWSDFADGFKKGFTGTLDVASKVLPFL